MHSCLYEGQVVHHRHTPMQHAFRYSLFLMYLDLEELDTVFRGRWLWSTRRPAIARFHRNDHLGASDVPLEVAVRDLVENRTGRRPDGPVRLLTHLRYFGYSMNPVSFYYCFDSEGRRVQAVVAEVNNTPWNEQHCYVIESPCDGEHSLPKAFHVSPFMGMDMHYAWRMTVPGDKLSVRMENYEKGGRIFDATLTLQRCPITGWTLARALIRHPLMTAKVAAAIYWQALRLKLKRVPFHPHPKHNRNSEVTSQ